MHGLSTWNSTIYIDDITISSLKYKPLLALYIHLCKPTSFWSCTCTQWKKYQETPLLANHPDQALASYIHKGLLPWFRIGTAIIQCSCVLAMQTTHQHSTTRKVVEYRIAAEPAAGWLLGPYTLCTVVLHLQQYTNYSSDPELCSHKYDCERAAARPAELKDRWVLW